MPAAYVIVTLDIHDPATFETYRAQVPPTLEAYGGEFVVRGGSKEVLEGEWPEQRVVVLRFPSMDRAKAWHASPEYEGPLKLRQSASEGKMIVVEGVQ